MILDSLHCRRTINIEHKSYDIFSLKALAAHTDADITRLPFSLKIILENLLRHEDGKVVKTADIHALLNWLKSKTSQHEIAFHPARVLMQDFTGVPAIVDLAAMRDAMNRQGFDAQRINPLIPVDLVIDHSVQVDHFGSPESFMSNVSLEMTRNNERYQFLRWGQQAFKNFRVVPPGTGICHQVNLEYLANVIWKNTDAARPLLYPDTVFGTDSHTTMINGLGVLGWGVGGIEAEAAMLGQAYSMVIPDVIGFKLDGQLREGITATDLVLTITQMLRAHGVVGKFVEFFGPGLQHLSLADRATIANMAPEYGATCGIFPIDQETLRYLTLTNRSEETIAIVKAYAQEQDFWRKETDPDPIFTATIHLDLGTVEPCLAGPKRPQDRVPLQQVKTVIAKTCTEQQLDLNHSVELTTRKARLHHGDVVIAAITSCTNTSNPNVLIAAGLLAKKAIERGLSCKPWVKTSLAPGSKVVTEYLERTGLQTYLDQLGFNLVGYGCTTCIGNSGPLPEDVSAAITQGNLLVSSVLSGNRNFEGRVHPQVKANWLASPPLVVAYAIAGTTHIDLHTEPLGKDAQGKDIFLKDIWPTNAEIAKACSQVSSEMFKKMYADVFTGDAAWQSLKVTSGVTYTWDTNSTYIQNPPYFTGEKTHTVGSILNARVLALLGDSITTDHISPAGSIKKDSPAGKFLLAAKVSAEDFNSYGARRGNHEVMMRGTFANIRIRNEMVDGIEGGVTKHFPSKEVLSIYDAAMRYKNEKIPTVIIAGKEYGTGSSRDWAAKGPYLQGVKAVIAESFERIHRSNLIGMGILPLEFKNNDTRKSLGLCGDERIDVDIETIQSRQDIQVTIHFADGRSNTIVTRSRLDTDTEVDYYKNGGILHYVLRQLGQ